MNPLEDVIRFLKQTDEFEAGSTLLHAFEKYAVDLQQFDILGKLYYEIKDYTSSIRVTEHALTLTKTPQEQYSVRSNLAKLYNHTNNPDKALIHINKNIEANPLDYEPLMEKVFSLYLYGKHTESYELTVQLLNDQRIPVSVRNRSKYNLGSYLLDEDKFKEGMKTYIHTGHEIKIWTNYKPSHLIEWTGQIDIGKEVAIIGEGGIGDEIIALRFYKNIKQMGMKPKFVTSRQSTYDLFVNNGYDCVKNDTELKQGQYYIKAMYLPIVLDLDQSQIWTGEYLTPLYSYVEKWKKILPTGPKVAIKWRGNPYYDQDLHRSLPLDELDARLDFNRTDITFVSVQKDDFEGIDQYPNVLDVKEHLETLDDLLACLSLMNYTVTSCTSVAHIAGAAGLPFTVCPPIATYYCWLGSTKWYNEKCTVRRQKEWKSWHHLNNLMTDIEAYL